MPARLHLADYLSAEALQQRYQGSKDPPERTHWQVISLVSTQRGSDTAPSDPGHGIQAAMPRRRSVFKPELPRRLTCAQEAPGQSIPQLFTRRYDTKAACTLFSHPEVTPDARQAGHRHQVRERLQERGTVLLLKDTSDLSWPVFAAIAIMSIVAVRPLAFKEWVRLRPEAPAPDAGLDPLGVRLLELRLERTLHAVGDVAFPLGRLGGHMNRRSDSYPGWITPWRGWLLPAVSAKVFHLLLSAFAAGQGAGRHKRILLVLDQAGWHGAHELRPPEVLELVSLPPYTTELMPVEHVWNLSDEPLAKRVFDSLEELESALGNRCCIPANRPEVIRAHTLFRRWPRTTDDD